MAGRVRLAPIGPEHVHPLAQLRLKNHTDLRRVMPMRASDPMTLARAIAEAQSRALADPQDRARRYTILLDERPVGDLTFSGIVREPMQTADVGLFVDRDVRGQGVGTAAVALACELAFGELALHRLEAGIQPTNHASLAAFRRNEFTEIGLAAGYIFIDGAWRDHLLLQKLAPGQ